MAEITFFYISPKRVRRTKDRTESVVAAGVAGRGGGETEGAGTATHRWDAAPLTVGRQNSRFFELEM